LQRIPRRVLVPKRESLPTGKDLPIGSVMESRGEGLHAVLQSEHAVESCEAEETTRLSFFHSAGHGANVSAWNIHVSVRRGHQTRFAIQLPPT